MFLLCLLFLLLLTTPVPLIHVKFPKMTWANRNSYCLLVSKNASVILKYKIHVL